MGSEDDLVCYEKLQEAVQVHHKALDYLVSVNSLFTAAIFVGVAFASTGQQNIEGKKECEAGVSVAKRLVKYEVISFTCYLLSSLVAKSLKTHLFTYLITLPTLKDITSLSSKKMRGSLFALSTLASIFGGLLLLISMIDMIQLRLGKFTCQGTQGLTAVGVWIGFHSLALVIYIPFVEHAIGKSTMIFDKLPTDK